MRNAPEPGWLFLYLLGGLPFGMLVLYVSTGGQQLVSNDPPSAGSWPGFVVGLVLVTYYWWPAWIQLARYGRPKKRIRYDAKTREYVDPETGVRTRRRPVSPETLARLEANPFALASAETQRWWAKKVAERTEEAKRNP